jgi:type II secretory pathway pseudopilin PulG
MTLVELQVAMTVMTITAAIFTAGLVQVYRVTNSAEAATEARQQLAVVFDRLDREVRYASGFSLPATVGFDSYVEYLIDDDGTPTCVQLRLNTAARQVQRRTWSDVSPIAVTPWRILVSNATTGPAVAPFVRHVADVVHDYQRLQVSLASSAGRGDTARTQQSTLLFTALNSDEADTDDATCTGGRSVA